MTSADVADHSLASRDRSIAAMREELFRIARGAQVDALDGADSGVVQQALGNCPEIEVPAPECRSAEARAIVGSDLVADLVATRSDPGTDDCHKLPTERRHARFDDPPEQTAPAGVQECQRGASIHPSERDRKASGG